MKKMSTKFDYKKGLCAPTLIAIGLTVMSLLGGGKTKSDDLISQIVLIAILFTLCYYGHPKAAWGVLLIPFVFVVLMMLGFMHIIEEEIEHNKK